MAIRIKLTGGLGNQMFQFAAGYAVARRNNVELSLDLRRFNRRPLHNGFELQKVFDIFSERYSKRMGGYSRVIKAGFRTGDDAPMAVIELIDRNVEAKKVDKPKKVASREEKKDTSLKAATK